MARILVIDDDEIIAELLQSVLAEGGHSATAIASIQSLQQEEAGRFDLVITDLLSASPYSASGAGSWVAEVRRRLPGVPVVVCTAHRSAANDEAGIAADAVITKPFDIHTLLAIVHRLTSGGAR